MRALFVLEEEYVGYGHYGVGSTRLDKIRPNTTSWVILRASKQIDIQADSIICSTLWWELKTDDANQCTV